MNLSDHSIVYQIRLEGHVCEDWFEGFTVETCPQGETIITGMMDQSALQGLLSRICDLGLVLLSIQSNLNKKGITHE